MAQRKILWRNKEGELKGVFDTPEEASSTTGIKLDHIRRCLAGTLNDTKFGYRFEWEVTGADLVDQRRNRNETRSALERAKAQKWFKE